MLDADKVLVPVTGDAIDETVVTMACNLVRKKKIEVIVLYVIEVKRSLPLDAEMEADTQRGETVLHRAERLVREQDCRAETALIQARESGPAIVQEATERNVDAVMIGVSYRTRFGVFNLNNTVDYVLKNAPCHVVVYREPAPTKMP